MQGDLPGIKQIFKFLYGNKKIQTYQACEKAFMYFS